ncbi:helix-turn-helix transcriptional regulator [Candidatus Poriferisodalis sp.]|uniref:helix-turn-helix transcriptional regulator n=1 Tax=Candidatus Poriferisodalis sp. TaxID=3101277 RepID=UPI003B02D8F4
MDDLTIFRLPAVIELTSLSRSTIWRRVKEGSFPQPLRLGGTDSSARGWRKGDIEKWLTELEPVR